MNKFVENFAKLIDLKTILSLICAGLLVFCTITGKIEGKDALIIISMVFTYFFNKKDGGEDGRL